MSKVFPIETVGGSQATPTSVRIKRQFDQKYYDATDGIFKAEKDCQSPFVVLLPSLSLNTPNNMATYITIDPKQFLDGDYLVFFHDTSTPAMVNFAISEVSIVGGDCSTQVVPNITQIAGRILDGTVLSHSSPGSVGAWMQSVSASLKLIQTKLGV
jgi:hypothetical protein